MDNDLNWRFFYYIQVSFDVCLNFNFIVLFYSFTLYKYKNQIPAIENVHNNYPLKLTKTLNELIQKLTILIIYSNYVMQALGCVKFYFMVQ